MVWKSFHLFQHQRCEQNSCSNWISACLAKNTNEDRTKMRTLHGQTDRPCMQFRINGILRTCATSTSEQGASTHCKVQNVPAPPPRKKHCTHPNVVRAFYFDQFCSHVLSSLFPVTSQVRSVQDLCLTFTVPLFAVEWHRRVLQNFDWNVKIEKIWPHQQFLLPKEPSEINSKTPEKFLLAAWKVKALDRMQVWKKDHSHHWRIITLVCLHGCNVKLTAGVQFNWATHKLHDRCGKRCICRVQETTRRNADWDNAFFASSDAACTAHCCYKGSWSKSMACSISVYMWTLQIRFLSAKVQLCQLVISKTPQTNIREHAHR